MSLRAFLIKRIIYTIVLVLFVIVLNWVIFEAMPGETGALYSYLGQPKLQPRQLQAQIHLFGFDQPPLQRFLSYFQAMLTFNFGYSFQSGGSISQELISTGRLQNTLLLLGVSTILSIVIGVLLGIVVSYKRGSFLDSFWVTSSLTSYSLPTFFIGIILIFIFTYSLNWFPQAGTEPIDWISGNPQLPAIWIQILVRLQYLFLPALTLTLFSYGGFLLLTRATMMEALSEDYITTARAKGLATRVILLHHAFKNASLPVITSSALAFGTILSGAIITETIYRWAGIGFWIFNAITYKDFPVLQAMFYIIALTVIAANFISDILYGIVDPRIRYD